MEIWRKKISLSFQWSRDCLCLTSDYGTVQEEKLSDTSEKWLIDVIFQRVSILSCNLILVYLPLCTFSLLLLLKDLFALSLEIHCIQRIRKTCLLIVCVCVCAWCVCLCVFNARRTVSYKFWGYQGFVSLERRFINEIYCP